MKSSSKKTTEICVLLFLIYLCTILALEAGTGYQMFVLAFFLLLPWAFVFWGIQKNRAVACEISAARKDESSSFLVPALAALIVLFSSSLFWFAYYPGFFNLDADGQWLQVHGLIPYSDWHPLGSTLLIQLVLSIHDSLEFYIAVQLVLFALSTANLFASLQKYSLSNKLLIGMAFFIGLSPAIGLNSISATKDVQFTILIMNVTACVIRIIQTEGVWLAKPGHIALLSSLLGLTILVRHNGVLYVLPALLLLMLFYSSQQRRVIISALITMLIALTIKYPVSAILNVEPHDNVKGELVGIPMGIMGNALISDPDSIPEDVHIFLNRFAPDSVWNDLYVPGEWDSCKWEFNSDEVIGETPLSEIMHYTWETIASCPEASYDSFRLNTKIVWDPIRTESFWIPEEYIAPNEFGIESKPNGILHSIGEEIKKISLIPVLSPIIWNTGFQTVLIIVAFCIFGYHLSPKCLALFLPLLIYDWGTMFLLAGPNQRYFYCNGVLFLPVLASLACEGSGK